jgi:Zn-dependent protease
MHALTSFFLGDRLAHDGGRLSLNPLQHIDPLTTVALPILLLILGQQPFAAAKPVRVRPWALKGREYGMALVALAGPLSNFLLAIIFSLGLRYFRATSDNQIVSIFFSYGVSLNVGMAVFNLIPFPPLDGSRLLYAIAPDSLREIMNRIESFGFASIIFFMFVIYPHINSFLFNIKEQIIKMF